MAKRFEEMFRLEADDGAPGAGGGEPTPPEPPAPQAEPAEPGSLTNNDVKNNELFKKVTAELAAAKKILQDKADAEAKAIADAELEKAKAAGDYEALLEKRDAEAAEKEAKYNAKVNSLTLKYELSAAGFEKRGIDLLTIEYNPETHGTVEEYAKLVAEDESNKKFMASGPKAPPEPPGKPGAPSTGMNLEMMYKFEGSSDPAIQQQVRDFKRAYWDKNGHMPPKR